MNVRFLPTGQFWIGTQSTQRCPPEQGYSLEFIREPKSQNNKDKTRGRESQSDVVALCLLVLTIDCSHHTEHHKS